MTDKSKIIVERNKAVKYISTLEGTIPEALLKDNKELATAQKYLKTLDDQLSDIEATEKKEAEKVATATAKRVKTSQKVVDTFQDKIVVLVDELIKAQDGLEPEQKRQLADMAGKVRTAIFPITLQRHKK